MQYVFLAIFLIATTIHLYARIKRIARVRDISKIFILLPLTFFYIFSVDKINVFVVLALACCWLGDVLLIFHGIKWFALGGSSFLIGHIFFIIAYNYDISYNAIPIWVLILMPLIAITTVVIVCYKLKPYIKKALFIPTVGYLCANASMNVFAIFRLASSLSLNANFIGPMLTVVGALLFFVSDTSLFFVRFNKNSIMKTHFLVMITYSIGELLIVLGLII